MSLAARGPWFKLGLLGSLYFSQGLPYGFFTQALPVILREEGLSLGVIGMSSLLALPWAAKFLWAPFVDRSSLPGVGRRKSWIVPLQSLAALFLATLAAYTWIRGELSISWLLVAVFGLNALAATQDIATDGLAVEILRPGERGWGNGLQVAGYRVGMIVGGGVLLILHPQLGNAGIFAAMSLLLALATVPIARAKEPPRPVDEDLSTGPAPVHFLRRPGHGRILLLVVAYKFGESFAKSMLRPYLSDGGASLSDIGWLLGTVGFVAGLAGAVVGGLAVNAVGRRRALLAFGTLQALSVAGYAWMATGVPTQTELYYFCGLEHFASGMATAVLFTCMMDWCAPESAGTDYTVQASAVVIATGLASALAGFSAERFGYAGHFALGSALAVGAVVVVALVFPRGWAEGRGGEAG